MEKTGANRKIRVDLQPKILFSVIVCTCIVVFLSGALIIGREKRSLITSLKDKGNSIAKSVAETAERAIRTSDYEFLEREANSILNSAREIIYVRFLDKEGRIIAASKRPEEIGEKDILKVFAPILSKGQETGGVEIGLSTFYTKKSVARMILIITLMLAGIILVLGTAITINVRKLVIEPINKLKTMTAEIARGNLNYKVDLESGDEMEELAISFNKMAKQLRESELMFHSLFDHTPFSVWMCDREGTIIFANQAALNMFGVADPDQIVGRYNVFRDLSEEEKQFLTYFERAWAGEIVRFRQDLDMTKVKYNTVHRKTLHFYSTLFPLPTLGDQNPNIVVIQEDITKQVEAEEELRKYQVYLEELVKERTRNLEEKKRELERANVQLKELDRLKSLFIASMSHELRTPLNSIIGFTGIILQGLTGEITEEQRRQLTMVKNSANHLLALINDIIDVSKIETGKVKLDIKEFDLSKLVQDIKDFFAIALNKKGLKISVEAPENLIIESDERRTKQVIVNLIGNAIKFTEKGEIKIKVTRKDEMIEVSVKDTGIGIKKEDLDKLFKPFSQAPSEERAPQEGTGLGLYLSKKIIELLGGEITVRSEFGKGSVFSFTLPSKYQGKNHEKNSGSRG